MNKNRLSLVVALAVSAVVLAGGWFLGVQPQLAMASANGTQQQTIDATNGKNRIELARLAKAFTTLDSTKAELSGLQASIPATTDTGPFIRSLYSYAEATDVRITSVTFADPKPYAPEASAAGAPASAASSATPSATPSPTASATPSAPASAAAALPQAVLPHSDPEITGANFTVIGVDLSVDGSYDQALAFTKAVQGGDRLFLVSDIAAASTDELPPMDAQSWSLTGEIYVLTDPSATPAAG
ncbi:hypothetical protein ASG04_05830 [Curtobacterium sp. Leaf183]|uniref:hypothetical protein n=1 Tax=Curtobacterium sp. Leaf183 TaxID=1736291 RepID=UPI0006F54133|nr:hypothetical protein [Curtobacterium sp. Leaf183]KQS10095.1 hypothetical protein ASG04_05830 [Curtobacterium sp. Leaf183]